jgi:uncharacterized protein YuzE
METTTISTQVPGSVFQAVPLLIDFPVRRFWVDYDKEADVLYISLQRPQRATNTKMTDEGILLRYNDDRLVGITVLDASARSCVSARDGTGKTRTS